MGTPNPGNLAVGISAKERLRHRKKCGGQSVTKPRKPPAPPGIGRRAQRLWRELQVDWTFSADELELLKLAVEAVDRATKAQEILKREGLTVLDRFQQVKEHPAVAIRNTAEINAARLLKQLGLHAVEERERKNAAIRTGVIGFQRARRGR